MANEYVARVSAKNGRSMHTTDSHPSREAAAKAAFIAKPNARSVSTSIAHNGKESHRDIRWHQKAEPKKVAESMTPRKTARAKPVREGLAYLIEDVMEKSEVVLAAQNIVDKLQGIAEDLSTVEAKEIMPLSDALTNAFGPEVANQFNSVATEQIRQLITAVQTAKSSVDGEIQRMKQGVEGGDMSDMGMNNPMGGEAPAAMPAPPTDGLPEGPPAPPEAELPPVDAGFAGREKKESAKPRGKKLGEDFLGGQPSVPAGASPPAIDQHPHKSENLAPNLANLDAFHGAAGKLARNIENMIDTGRLTGAERKAFTNVLSHFAAYAHDASHWSDAEGKLKMALEKADLYDTSKPELTKIVGLLRQLAHLVALKHQGMVETAIKELRISIDPDSLILETFRNKLMETRDAQTAAIRTARTFAIDIEDVVMIVREAAADRDRYGNKAVKEEKCPKCKGSGKFGGKSLQCKKCKGTGKVKAAVKEEWQKPWEKDKTKTKETEPKEEVAEDDAPEETENSPAQNGNGMIQNGTMFPVQTGNMPAPNPLISNPGPSSTSTPPVGGQTINPSTKPAMTPGDMRMRQQATNSANQAATNEPNAQPVGGQPMTPPTENGAPTPASAQTKQAPTNAPQQNAQTRNQFRFQRQQ